MESMSKENIPHREQGHNGQGTGTCTRFKSTSIHNHERLDHSREHINQAAQHWRTASA